MNSHNFVDLDNSSQVRPVPVKKRKCVPGIFHCIRVLTIFVMAESQTIALQFVRPTNHGVLFCAITTFDSPNIVALSFNAVVHNHSPCSHFFVVHRLTYANIVEALI